ncbi:MAG TPA: hypothetical protein DDW71_02440, partial [Lactobacillus sp.]|nr:hypothetical protein [Lactobacillus sp.]
QWAESKGHIIKSVCRFIEENPQQLAPNDHDADLYPTPRAWQRVSRNLQALSELPTEQQQQVRLDILKGDLGVTIGESFERFIRRQQTGLSAQEIYAGESLGPAIIQIFNGAGIDQQQSIMNSLIQQLGHYPLTEGTYAGRFTTLLNLMPVDAQFAVALKLAEIPDLLEQLYEAAQNEPLVKQLYDQLTAIGLKNDIS